MPDESRAIILKRRPNGIFKLDRLETRNYLDPYLLPTKLLTLGVFVKRRLMSKTQSRQVFKKNTGIQKLNVLNPRTKRGGIRL